MPPINKYWEVKLSNGQKKKYPVALSATCADRPAVGSININELVDTPTLAGYTLGAKGCSIPAATKFYEWYVDRYNGSALLFYAQGVGQLTVTLTGRNGTATPSSNSRIMTTNPSENQNATLFQGSKSHGAYFGNIPDGSYAATLTDEDGKSKTANLEVTALGPKTNLLNTGGGGENPNVTVVSRSITGSGSVTEGQSGTFNVVENLSDGTFRSYNQSVNWSLEGAPGGTSINASGQLTIAANSISNNLQIKVKAAITGAALEKVVSLINATTADATGDYLPTVFAGELGYMWDTTNPDRLQPKIKTLNLINGLWIYTIENIAPNPKNWPVQNKQAWIEINDEWIKNNDLSIYKFVGGMVYTIRWFIPWNGDSRDNAQNNPTDLTSVSFYLI
ncbi:hypothetical protein [Spirosoma sp.]|uniref:hypothetical protein n=1 Tax=Spirosoma sp. TaxID=1899569 RepID=UPI003B3A2617